MWLPAVHQDRICRSAWDDQLKGLPKAVGLTSSRLKFN
uniref:Uncharacterized protein n=1 Tax=Rhizophora mucronata TaxID=61149 RepID=A0A2P2NGQ4_RHIMU